jgi:RimJ/RimL family protein N-acetyltransferase
MTLPHIQLRPSIAEDAPFLKEWLSDPLILYGFPMEGEKEVDDSARIWIEYATKGYGITAVCDNKVCGMTVLYIQSFEKLAHTCLFSIIVSTEYRNKGVGSALLNALMRLAKETFHIEILHLEVYEGNPAKRLYERMGFTPFGKHVSFAKEADGSYRAKIFMQKNL